MLEGEDGTDYTDIVPAAAGAGVDSPKHVRRTSATNGVFLRLQFIYGGVRGEAGKPAGVLTGRSVNPAHNRRHLFDSSDGGLQFS